MRHTARLAKIERRAQRSGRTGGSLPIAILHPSMLDALGFTPEERTRLVRQATPAEISEWEQRRGHNARA